MSCTITPLTASIGARVTGIDLRDEVADDVATQLVDAFGRHGVLVVSQDHEVSSDEQARLATIFASPSRSPSSSSSARSRPR